MKFSQLGKYIGINSSLRKSSSWRSMELPKDDFKPQVELGTQVKLSAEYLKDLRGSVLHR